MLLEYICTSMYTPIEIAISELISKLQLACIENTRRFGRYGIGGGRQQHLVLVVQWYVLFRLYTCRMSQSCVAPAVHCTMYRGVYINVSDVWP